MTNQKRIQGESGLTHIDEHGAARMVDISDKVATIRCAVAHGVVRVSDELSCAIRSDTIQKGNLLETARLAGIQGSKHTSLLIPLCHPLPIDSVKVDLTHELNTITIHAEVKTTWKTGVEMEALAAVTIAALTIIDMGKAIDKGIVIERIRLLSKTGGKGGDYHA